MKGLAVERSLGGDQDRVFADQSAVDIEGEPVVRPYLGLEC